MIKLPRLLDSNLKEVARLHPSRVSITENIEPINTADMILPDGEPLIAVGDYIEMYLPGRSAGIYRAMNVMRDYYTGSQTIRLEHGAAELGDMIVPGENIFIGWDDGDPDMTITGFVANCYVRSTVITSSDDATRSSLFQNHPVRFKNRDGSEVSLQFRPGEILPIITLTDEGYKIPITSDIVNSASSIYGEWDNHETVGTKLSGSVLSITPYSNAHGIINRRCDAFMYNTTAQDASNAKFAAGERVEVTGITEVFTYYDYDTNSIKQNRFYSTEYGFILVDNVRLEPGYRVEEIGGTGTNHFFSVANALIDEVKLHYPNVRWRFGESDFTQSYGYKFENTNLLEALLKLPEKLRDKYKWEFDQTGDVWVVNLRRLDESNMAELRIGRNMTKLQVSIDTSNLVTCIYPIGRNGLTVEDVNGGQRYMFSTNADRYWHIEKVLQTDNETAYTLHEAGTLFLDEHSEPAVTISASALDLAELTGEPLDNFVIGKMCRVALPEYDLVVNEYITSLSWPDVYGAPEKINITLANRKETASSLLAKLLRK